MKPLRELARILGRLFSRSRLYLERRKLARLESALGLLGWQQADYEGPTQDEVKRLTDYEREQGRLTNESAQLGLEILKIEERRAFEEKEFANVQAATLRDTPVAAESADLEALEALLDAQRKEHREIEARLPVIDHEIDDAERRYRALVTETIPTPEVQAQLLLWHRVIAALPRERAEWAAKGEDVAEVIAELEDLLKDLKEERKNFEQRDEEMADEIATRQRAKRKVEKQIESLEKAKTNPYREIGRVLADHRIAPLNQPEALTVVLGQREKLATIEGAIAASLEESAREGGVSMWKCWVFMGWLIGSEAVAFLAIDGQ